MCDHERAREREDERVDPSHTIDTGEICALSLTDSLTSSTLSLSLAHFLSISRDSLTLYMCASRTTVMN